MVALVARVCQVYLSHRLDIDVFAGQQVTGYAHDDTNNHWQIIPTKSLPDWHQARIVRHEDVIQLLHVNTQTLLMTHDVASSLMATNQEFTTWPREDQTRYNDTLFHLEVVDGVIAEAWKSKSSHFRLVHVPTRVSMWTYSSQLPEWAFKQQEVNGNKNPTDKSAAWVVSDILETDAPIDLQDQKPKEPKKLGFFRKFAELQVLMLQHNAGLTASHPYASGPINWPFLISGISFWTENDSQKQIYLIGNLIGWWASVVALSIYFGIVGADLLARRRDVYPVPDEVRNRLWNSAGFFVLVWAVHYLPFFLMGRQLFIHHYLPSHLASAMVAGAVLNFVISETINFPVSIAGRSTKMHPSQYADLGIRGPVITGLFIFALFLMFMFLAPLTYGTPGLDGDTVNAKRLLSSWTLHFAAKVTDGQS